MPAHSFILYFKQFLKRNYKHFLEITTLILFLALGEMTLEYLLINDEGTMERAVMHDLYQASENIDNLYLGSSHVYCNINPYILDDINGKNNFNLATSGQPIIASYYLLKEADKRNDLECVYVDLYFGLLIGDRAKWREPDELGSSWKVMDQMEFSVNKLDWIMHSTAPGYVYLSLIPSIRYKSRILDFEYLAERLYNKSQADYRNYNGSEVSHKGYFFVEHIADELYYDRSKKSFEEPVQLSEEAKEYLIKIMEYCTVNDIELRLYANPVSGWVICRDVGDYDNYIAQVKELVSEYGLEYYDFNLCKKEYLDISDHMYWTDDNHLNADGAEVYTTFLGDFFEKINNGEIQSDDYFYDSYQQKLNDIDEEVFGLVVEELNDERKADCFETTGIQADCDDYRLFLLTAENNFRNDKIEFYIYSEDIKTGEKGYVQDWSENNVYILPADVEECRIYVKLRAAKTKQEYGEAVIGY